MTNNHAQILRTILSITFRVLLVIVTIALLLVMGLCMVMNMIFNGPSPAARDLLTMTLLEPSATKWIPALFMGEELVEQIRADAENTDVLDDVSSGSQVIINNSSINGSSDEWANYPDGIRIETIQGDTYTAHVMIIRDPSTVYLATSTDNFSLDTPGSRITKQIEKEGAIAAINAGAFNDDGTGGSYVGSLPVGLVIADGKVAWDDGQIYEGFVGFNQDNILVVANSMDAATAMSLGIRDGCCFGPVLLMDGKINEVEFSSNSGYNPRTAIGQRADGAVIFVCIDGRQVGSLGGTYSDIIDIMVEYGAVNACNLDGGSSSVMLYRDNEGRYGEAGEVVMINSYSLLQESPRRMPTFFMVKGPESED